MKDNVEKKTVNIYSWCWELIIEYRSRTIQYDGVPLAAHCFKSKPKVEILFIFCASWKLWSLHMPATNGAGYHFWVILFTALEDRSQAWCWINKTFICGHGGMPPISAQSGTSFGQDAKDSFIFVRYDTMYTGKWVAFILM